MDSMRYYYYYYFYPRLGDATSRDDRYDGPLGVTLSTSNPKSCIFCC